ncbi:helix-turn-helix transcriptional regulator [Adlercreutzia equolifaciens]|uniref:Helix-turn-helix transcriptional regulator n=1 Tax=Adlercreutzia equolifaciens TaxID=446660 RepID=A0A6L8Q4U3_9ACTN|nr:helix-turn-helix transcriptional regulator [Adlercreutzia equolifaciens]MZG28353.1 helix-turn-helix transcriptional regulator [Adlercreutzia equolifaciens]
MEGFALRDAGDDGRAPLALRPIHLVLVAFVATLPAHAPTIGAFAEAPQFEAIADTFLFALLLAAVTSSVVVLLRGLQRPRKVFARARVTAIAAAAYLLGTMGAVGLLFAPMPLPAAAVGAGLLAGAALPLLVAEWARAVAVPIDQALVLCAFVVLTASFVGWILALLPPSALVPVFRLLLVAGVVVPPVAARMGDPALPLARPADTMRRLVSVTWLPLLGFAVYAFMTDVMAHSAFGVVQASFLGGAVAALVMFGVCFLWGRTPLLPWSYRILVPLMAAAFVVLGAFPAGTFPRDASVVALYVFYIVLALLGCAVLLAVVRNRELPANVASGFACGVAAAAALLGQILSQVLTVTDDFAPWLAVLTGAFVAVLLVFLGRTSWNELVAPRESAAAEEPALAARSGTGDAPGGGAVGAAHGEEFEGAGAPDGSEPPVRPNASGDVFELAEPSMQNTLEARCAEVAAARGLSPREAEVLVFLARGFTPAYIAKSLVLSISTVRTHVRNIYRKLGVNKREELIHLIDER